MSEPVFEDIKENVNNLEKILNKTKLSPNELRKALEPFQNNDIKGFSAANLGSLNSYFGINKIKSMIGEAKALLIMLEVNEDSENTRLAKQRKIDNALDKEKHLDYDRALTIYEEIGDKKSAKRVRKLKTDLAAPKIEIHGDYVDDRDTIVKDSVVSKSNIGAGGDDKFTKLKELTVMKEKGLIDDDEFKQMKKEILGK